MLGNGRSRSPSGGRDEALGSGRSRAPKSKGGPERGGALGSPLNRGKSEIPRGAGKSEIGAPEGDLRFGRAGSEPGLPFPGSLDARRNAGKSACPRGAGRSSSFVALDFGMGRSRSPKASSAAARTLPVPFFASEFVRGAGRSTSKSNCAAGLGIGVTCPSRTAGNSASSNGVRDASASAEGLCTSTGGAMGARFGAAGAFRGAGRSRSKSSMARAGAGLGGETLGAGKSRSNSAAGGCLAFGRSTFLGAGKSRSSAFAAGSDEEPRRAGKSRSTSSGETSTSSLAGGGGGTFKAAMFGVLGAAGGAAKAGAMGGRFPSGEAPGAPMGGLGGTGLGRLALSNAGATAATRPSGKTWNDVPHLGQRIRKPLAGKRRSSSSYGAVQERQATLIISVGFRRDGPEPGYQGSGAPVSPTRRGAKDIRPLLDARRAVLVGWAPP